ncbi:MAG: zinc ribbon domain-containing protein [Deltaproteobacteria bacterium]|nr:zinc ribbon domain-containing protein [Deltaproteobacteria bacterium]
MPIYEYACNSCNHRFETWQRMTESPVDECPSCRGGQVRRLISATTFSLKGTGWYATDYKSGSSSNDNSRREKGNDNSSTSRSSAGKAS